MIENVLVRIFSKTVWPVVKASSGSVDSSLFTMAVKFLHRNMESYCWERDGGGRFFFYIYREKYLLKTFVRIRICKKNTCIRFLK